MNLSIDWDGTWYSICKLRYLLEQELKCSWKWHIWSQSAVDIDYIYSTWELVLWYGKAEQTDRKGHKHSGTTSRRESWFRNRDPWHSKNTSWSADEWRKHVWIDSFSHVVRSQCKTHALFILPGSWLVITIRLPMPTIASYFLQHATSKVGQHANNTNQTSHSHSCLLCSTALASRSSGT